MALDEIFPVGFDLRTIKVVGDALANPLMRSFLIEVIGIFPDNSCQMPAMKDEGMVQAFSS